MSANDDDEEEELTVTDVADLLQQQFAVITGVIFYIYHCLFELSSSFISYFKYFLLIYSQNF